MTLTEKEYQGLTTAMAEMADRLAELGADSVCIFTTSEASNGVTRADAAHRGNYYARLGVVSSWLADEQSEMVQVTGGEEDD